MSKTPSFDLTRRGEERISATSPIYARDADGLIHAVGTGIFLTHRGRAFVVTASHVLRDYIEVNELLIGGQSLFTLNQRYFSSTNEEAHDVGFIPLSDEQLSMLSDVTFVTGDDVDISTDYSERPYYLVGYRADDKPPEGSQTSLISGWSVYAARSASLETYRERQISNVDRLLLKFDRRTLVGLEGPVDPEADPEGMSGSGVWRFSPSCETDKLVAIVEAHSDSGDLIYAARLRNLMRALDDYTMGRLN